MTARGIRVAPILINPYTTAREGRLLEAHDPSPCCRGRLMIDRSYLRKATNGLIIPRPALAHMLALRG